MHLQKTSLSISQITDLALLQKGKMFFFPTVVGTSIDTSTCGEANSISVNLPVDQSYQLCRKIRRKNKFVTQYKRHSDKEPT